MRRNSPARSIYTPVAMVSRNRPEVKRINDRPGVRPPIPVLIIAGNCIIMPGWIITV
jgi:hypothetical protein